MNEGFVYTVRITWNNQDSFWWTDTCADVVEVFGLPGNRFMYHPHHDYMEFSFKTKQDHLLCQTLLSDRICYE